jgi:hypothetical protein
LLAAPAAAADEGADDEGADDEGADDDADDEEEVDDEGTDDTPFAVSDPSASAVPTLPATSSPEASTTLTEAS